MFSNITVAIITPIHTKKSFDMGLQLAKKFDSSLTIIECVYKIPPKFYFFETKADKKITQSQISKIKAELEKWEKIAQKNGIKIKTKFILTDSVAHSVVDYVLENKTDLLVVDYPKVSMVEATLYDDIINTIHHEARCHLLTMKPG
ncbi:MAG TPA: universal stress protein [Nitrosopumilaceae archaeon]|nr:universal stress protein [Nitrosopumilaceae archaeon]